MKTGARKATKKTSAASRGNGKTRAGNGKSAKPAPSAAALQSAGIWNLRLYVAGQSPKSMTALSNLRRLCDLHLPGQYHIEIIDLLKNPRLAQVDQILAIPTLVRKLPEPVKRVIGDLSDAERTMLGLDLRNVMQ